MKEKVVSKTLLWDLSLLLVAMVWGGGFVVTKNALEVITPLYFLSIRFMIAGIIMAIIFFPKLKKASWQDIKNSCIVGIFLSLGFITQTFGANLTTPAKSSFITGLNVVLVPFIMILFTKKFPGRKAVITAIVAFMGLSLISVNEQLTIGAGDFLTFLCAIFYACHIVSIGFYANKTDAIVLATIQVLFAGVVCSLLAIPFEPVPVLSGISIWSGILYSALLSTLAAFLIQNLAQRNTPSTHAAIILCLESVFGAIASVLFWNESMTLKMIIGCLLIFAAIIINEVDFSALLDKSKDSTEQV
ncbi:MAG: family transporter [Clostridia bacterium]|nr:family transporter [Clostridia bacterium]